MTFEWVKWRRGPRTSQIPSSCSRQPDSSQSKILLARRQASSEAPSPWRRALVERLDDLAVDVELELVRRAVSDADRLRALVAAEPGKLELGQPPLACDAVHDLEVLRVEPAIARRSQSRHVTRLFDVAGADECEQRQRRVAEPAEAVVPVPHAADPLRQRRRRRGDDSAGRRIREGLERQQASDAPRRASDLRTCTATAHSSQNASVSARASSGSIGSGGGARWRGTSEGRRGRGRPPPR